MKGPSPPPLFKDQGKTSDFLIKMMRVTVMFMEESLKSENRK